MSSRLEFPFLLLTPVLFKLSFADLRLNQTKPPWREQLEGQNNCDNFRIKEIPSVEAQIQFCFILYIPA